MSKAAFAHFTEDRGICLLGEISLDHAQAEFVLRLGVRRVADHARGFAELSVQQERIVPLEAATACRSVHVRRLDKQTANTPAMRDLVAGAALLRFADERKSSISPAAQAGAIELRNEAGRIFLAAVPAIPASPGYQ